MNPESISIKRLFLSRVRNQSGMTLVETLIGVFVFGIVFTAGISGLKYSSSIGSQQNELATVNTVLKHVVEDIKNMSFLSINNALNYNTGTGGADKPSSLDELTNGSISVTVTEPDAGYPTLKRIVLSISWDGTTGGSRSKELTIFETDI